MHGTSLVCWGPSILDLSLVSPSSLFVRLLLLAYILLWALPAPSPDGTHSPPQSSCALSAEAPSPLPLKIESNRDPPLIEKDQVKVKERAEVSETANCCTTRVEALDTNEQE